MYFKNPYIFYIFEFYIFLIYFANKHQIFLYENYEI